MRKEMLIQLLPSVASSCTQELSDKKVYAQENRKDFRGNDNLICEQKYYYIKQSSSVVSGTPFTCIKDDLSSALSKASEALSKGAGSEGVLRTIEVCSNHIKKRVYGISSHTIENQFYNLLGIREDYLLMSLGNVKCWDPSVMTVLGPKSVDCATVLSFGKTIRRYNMI